MIHIDVIRSFRDKTAGAVFNGEYPKGFPANLVRAARRKLRYLNAAGDLGDLRSPPGNRLEPLAGDRMGQHSIRINDQFRLCFVWTAEGPAQVEIVDYQKKRTRQWRRSSSPCIPGRFCGRSF